MKLVQDWKLAWTWLSVHCMASAAFLAASSDAIMQYWVKLPPDWQVIISSHFSVSVIFRVISIISLAGIIGRIIQQKVS